MPARLAALLAAVFILPGCAVVATADGQRLALTSPDFRAYVERVFRDQNRLADELAFALESVAVAPPELVAAEESLLEACAGVNELATARRDERPLGARRSSRAARSVPVCEQATTSGAAALEAARR